MLHYLIIRYKRKLINKNTSNHKFYLDAKEELKEWGEDFSPEEAMDLINVLKNWLIHNKFPYLKYKIKNIIHQLIRKD